MKLPSFRIEPSPDNPSAVQLSLDRDEWTHESDHDAVLLQLGIVFEPHIGSVLNERTLGYARLSMSHHLIRMAQTDQILFIESGTGGQWVLETHARLRRHVRGY